MLPTLPPLYMGYSFSAQNGYAMIHLQRLLRAC